MTTLPQYIDTQESNEIDLQSPPNKSSLDNSVVKRVINGNSLEEEMIKEVVDEIQEAIDEPE